MIQNFYSKKAKIPTIIAKLCRAGACIVGSYAEHLIYGTEYKDYDLIVPFQNWNSVSVLIPKTAILNNYGGWKFECEEKSVDVWPGSVTNYLKQYCGTGIPVVLDIIHKNIYSIKRYEGKQNVKL